MEVYYTVVFGILGLLLGSFYNVVGYRLPLHKSIIKPRSHCPKCKHVLTPLELIPVFSFLIQKGKCKQCQKPISWVYAFFEFLTGGLFALSYLKFGLSLELISSLIIVSALIIIVISDIHHMIILDEILIISVILLIIIKLFDFNLLTVGLSVLEGIGAFFAMWMLKLLGDFLFKKESLGGGDIKLLGFFGFIIGFPMSLVSIFIGAVTALPISLIIMNKTKENIIPFGPFLSFSALMIYLTSFNFENFINLLT